MEDEFGLDDVDDDVQSYWWRVVRYESKSMSLEWFSCPGKEWRTDHM